MKTAIWVPQTEQDWILVGERAANWLRMGVKYVYPWDKPPLPENMHPTQSDRKKQQEYEQLFAAQATQKNNKNRSDATISAQEKISL
jgi:hypothetical protein